MQRPFTDQHPRPAAPSFLRTLALAAAAAISSALPAAEQAEKAPQGTEAAAAATAAERFVFEAPGWGGERIGLPPGFAPDMKLRGVEEIRFAPGMFRAGADDFFTYLFVLAVPPGQPLTKDVVHRELLAYYRGLATAVLKGKTPPQPVDPADFTLRLETPPAAETDGLESLPAGAKNVVHLRGVLSWTEPFATLRPQTLHFEIQTFNLPGTRSNYGFVCASPVKPKDGEPWAAMRKIRTSFALSVSPEKD